MTTSLRTAIDTAAHHTITAAPQAPAPDGSVPVSVLLIIVLGIWAWNMHKHGKDTKKLNLLPGFVCLGLGLSLSGTQVGTMLGTLFGSVGQMLATFIGNA
ncbi:hypothetical protein QCN29_26865 [Streptomyces sp. HNM0663]|uniref:Uncharacterized protein n=1 Tax=Streptomyces chengmaiensis TaxID=3040919 RepID=A0ABT6HWA8_9ACTN|nr:hypothetical protein [Streptomyces chengmaiensis]MDH2392334.1 hypothetical protein [Streptomyces chengmaiensis]